MRIRIIGGSDAGISAALRAREVNPKAEVSGFSAERRRIGTIWPAYPVQMSAQAWHRRGSVWRNRYAKTASTDPVPGELRAKPDG